MSAELVQDSVLHGNDAAHAAEVADRYGSAVLHRCLALAPFLADLRRDSSSAIKHLLIALEDGSEATVVSRFHAGKKAPNHVDHTFYTGTPDVVIGS